LLINFKTTIDFSNPESLRALTTALMKYLCGVEWTIPKGKLCPRVPNRLNYLMWVRELMKERN
jgi:23S rRNA A1618 N6-methylase RlmF